MKTIQGKPNGSLIAMTRTPGAHGAGCSGSRRSSAEYPLIFDGNAGVRAAWQRDESGGYKGCLIARSNRWD